MGKRVAMVVPNSCDPDYRVVKQAESLASAGYEVRIFCTWKPGSGVPIFEEINGVTYVRREWNIFELIMKMLFGSTRNSDTIKLDNRYRGSEDK